MEPRKKMATRRRMIYLAVPAVVSICVVIGVIALWPRDPKTLVNIDNPQVIELGQKVYAEHCASCHGTALEGQPKWRERNADGRLPAPPHDDGGHSWHHSDLVLFGITKSGPATFAGLDDYESDMPAFDGILTDQEIWAAIAYIKSRWTPAILARQKGISQRSVTD